VQKFVSEDELQTFDGWLRYHAVDATAAPPEEIERWRRTFDEARKRSAATPKVGLMKLQPVPGEHKYAVAVRDGADLWLTLWVRRSRKGEFFVMVPRADREWDAHTSYHLDGTLHMKSYGQKALECANHQPLNGLFRGAECIGAFAGHGPKGVGAVCDPKMFSGVVEVGPGVLGPHDGTVTVDLVEPGCQPIEFPWTKIDRKEIFRDFIPWVVITVGSSG
jgi:hypothetical protein